MNIIRHKDAKAGGLYLYYTGKPCRNGHDSPRYTSSGGCAQCIKEKAEAAKEEKSRYDRDRYKKSAEQVKQRMRRWRAENSAKHVDAARAWALANPEKRKGVIKAYKARRRQMEDGGDRSSIIMAWERAAPKFCHWCKSKCEYNYHVDHYQPLSKGGKHVVDNLVIACPTCNLRKSAKDPYEFAASLGRLF